MKLVNVANLVVKLLTKYQCNEYRRYEEKV